MHRLLERLRRRDYLGGLQTLVLIALGACAVGAALGLWGMLTRARISVPAGSGVTIPPGAVAGLLPGVRLDPDAEVRVVVEHPSAAQVAWHAAQDVPWFAIAVFMLVMLLLVVRTARRGDPFAAANVRRLRAAGWVVFLGSLAAFELSLFAGLELSATVTTAPPSTAGDLPLVWCFCGFGFLALAEIINRGRALQTELAEVI